MNAPSIPPAPTRSVPRWHGWGAFVAAPLSVAFLPPKTPRWVGMWVLAFAIFAACKWLTWKRTPAPQSPLWKHLGYLFAWPGMDAAAFLRGGPPRPPTRRECAFALVQAAGGAGLVFAASRMLAADVPAYAVGWVGMVGTVMALHFGAFRLLSCGWRAVGVDARPLMDRPLAATSLGDFWGRRWNTAFRDLTHRFFFRPSHRRLGATAALLLGFLFSGLVHDSVISVPAGGGYGGPTLFFLIQAVALLVERSALGRRTGLGRGVRGWCFTLLVLVAPVGLLLHPPFVVGVMVPFVAFTGSL